MQVLLTTLNAKYIHLNLAIRLFYELFKKNHNLHLKEFTIKEDKDAIANYCKDFTVVAFSCYIWNITQTIEVCKKIKALNPNTKILLGGPEVSYEWQEVIALDCIDYIITGEGEIPLEQFLNNFPAKLQAVSNLVRKENGTVIHNQKAETFDLIRYKDINPYINDSPEELNNKVCYIETSRGCPYKCEFCLASLDNKVRYLPNVTIKQHLFYLMQSGKTIKFLDRTFNIKKDFTLDIFKFILEHHRPENVFQFEITADILHQDIIKYINEHVPKGLFRFEIGIQTVNQKANLEVSRKQNFDKTKGIILALNHKVEMHLDLIVGLPLDYWDDIKYSIEEVFKLHPPEMQLGFLKFLKGTPMRNKEQHGFIFDPNPPYQLIESKYLSKQELADIVKLENALEIYWNDKRGTNLLKYASQHYSIFEFLLELGKYFGTVRDYHKYSLDDVYNIAASFVDKHYINDKILKQLIAIDYYVHHKVKPKPLILEDLERSQKIKLIEELKLNHHKYRFVILPLTFNYTIFFKENRIVLEDYNLIIQYNGITKAEILKHKLEDAVINNTL